jgi:hypothetical protein
MTLTSVVPSLYAHINYDTINIMEMLTLKKCVYPSYRINYITGTVIVIYNY